MLLVRVCLLCKRFFLSPEEPGYSELTPGCPADMGCGKGHWDLSDLNGSEHLREKMRSAEKCKDWKYHKEE